MDNNSLSHTRWKCQYHIVRIPKYRKKVLYGKLKQDVREIIQTLCKYKNVEIIAGAVCEEHVHLSVAIPPKKMPEVPPYRADQQHACDTALWGSAVIAPLEGQR